MNYFIVDLQSDYKAFGDYKSIKSLLIELLYDDTFSNRNDEDIVMNNLKIIRRLAEEYSTPISFLVRELESYGYKVIDLLELQRDLEDIKQFVGKDELFDEVINLINKGE